MREKIDLLTPFQTTPKPSRRWWKGGKGLGWAALVFALVFILLAFVFGWRGDDEDKKTDPATPPAAAGGTWYFFDPETGQGIYTISLFGDGSSGPIDVIEDQTDVGTYTWEGSTLTINFTRVMKMSDTFEFEEPTEFVCTGTPDVREMECDHHRQEWFYDPEEGLSITGTSDWVARAERR